MTVPELHFGQLRSGRTQTFHVQPAAFSQRFGLCRGSGLRVAGRRTLRKAASAESIESVRGEHEPGPFVANAPRNANITSISVADRKRITLPTVLTLVRLAALPVLVAAWYQKPEPAGTLIAGLFAVASATDYVDGFIARKMGSTSAFGAFLDPVVDKLLVAAVLILLCTRPIPAGPCAGNTAILPVLATVIICREITMSAVREWAATLGKKAYRKVNVSSWGKYKTGIQMAGLTFLLYGFKAGPSDLATRACEFGVPLLAVAALITAFSLADYFRKLWSVL